MGSDKQSYKRDDIDDEENDRDAPYARAIEIVAALHLVQKGHSSDRRHGAAPSRVRAPANSKSSAIHYKYFVIRIIDAGG